MYPDFWSFEAFGFSIRPRTLRRRSTGSRVGTVQGCTMTTPVITRRAGAELGRWRVYRPHGTTAFLKYKPMELPFRFWLLTGQERYLQDCRSLFGPDLSRDGCLFDGRMQVSTYCGCVITLARCPSCLTFEPHARHFLGCNQCTGSLGQTANISLCRANGFEDVVGRLIMFNYLVDYPFRQHI